MLSLKKVFCLQLLLDWSAHILSFRERVQRRPKVQLTLKGEETRSKSKLWQRDIPSLFQGKSPLL